MTLADKAAIDEAAAAMVGLIVGGLEPKKFMRSIGLDPEAVLAYSREAAADEFAVTPGLPPPVPAEGELRDIGLTDKQRAKVEEALVATCMMGMQLGMLLGLTRTRQPRP